MLWPIATKKTDNFADRISNSQFIPRWISISQKNNRERSNKSIEKALLACSVSSQDLSKVFLDLQGKFMSLQHANSQFIPDWNSILQENNRERSNKSTVSLLACSVHHKICL